MKRRVAVCGFLWSLLAAGASVAWCAYVTTTGVALLEKPFVEEGVQLPDVVLFVAGVTWALMMSVTTYQRFYVELSNWMPIVKVTDGRVWFARLILIASLVPPLLLIRTSDEAAIAAGVTATCVYMALHWAFRPENILPAWMFVVLDPVGALFRPARHSEQYRLLQRRKRMNQYQHGRKPERP